MRAIKKREIQRREHMVRLLAVLAREKYDRGAREHGGDLHIKTPLELFMEIRDEAIDAFFYAQSGIDKLTGVK